MMWAKHSSMIHQKSFCRSSYHSMLLRMVSGRGVCAVCCHTPSIAPFQRPQCIVKKCYYHSTIQRNHNDSTKTTTTTTSSSSSTSKNDLFLPHDLGGDLSSYGAIIGTTSATANDLSKWEEECHAMVALLASQQYFSTDQLRFKIETLTPLQYKEWTYYEKWSAAMTSLLLEKGIITHTELQETLFGNMETSTSTKTTSTKPLFQTGDPVRVKSYMSSFEWKRPHIRTPGYIYGAHGIIERVCGRHGDPSFLAFGLVEATPERQLYRVQFRFCDIWPEHYNNNHDNHNGGDTIEVDIYEHWLEPSPTGFGHDYSNLELFNHASGDDCIIIHSKDDNHHDDDDHHHPHHDHSHDHHHHHHVHEARHVVEERAVQKEDIPRPGQELFEALRKLLLKKQVITGEQLRQMTERLDSAGVQLDGAKLVVQSWLDPSFQKRLLSDTRAAAESMGISVSNPNAPTVLTVVPNTPDTHNLVVCTLCSCYPSGLLGIAPSWYKSKEYRSRAVREPRAVLSEFGLDFSDYKKKKRIRVHDSTADHRYLVLPEKPNGVEGWTAEQLHKIVTRDTMIGVAIVKDQ